MKTVALPDGRTVAALGQGTWMLGEDRRRQAEETATIRAGVERGMTVVDTAEMYGDGATETFLGHALAGLRGRVFLVSKALPSHAGVAQLASACEGSLRRLKTDRLDLYLLHWRGGVPLEETIEGMHRLQQVGKIGAWGVSNFDTVDMRELVACGGADCASNQILFNLSRRGPEFDLLPLLEAHAMPFMAYSPLEQGRLLTSKTLRDLAVQKGVAPLQLALAWVLQNPHAIVIPKASSIAHMEQNAAAAALQLTDEDRHALDAAFPPPRRKTALAML